MPHGIRRKYGTLAAILAFTAGSAMADSSEGEGADERDMPVVEVVERFEPAPLTRQDYFRPAAKNMDAALSKDLDRMLTSAVNDGYEWLSERLETKGQTRVAATDDAARPITLASAPNSRETAGRVSM